MKKLTTTIILVALALMFTGCGNNIVKKSIEQANTAIEGKDYDKALLALELALDEENDNVEANKLYSILQSYQKAKKAVDENKINEAKEILGEIDLSYRNYAIKSDIDSLNNQVKEKENNAPSSFGDAVNLILKEDGEYLKEIYNSENLDYYLIGTSNIQDYNNSWDIPNEKVYFIEIGEYSAYFVGIESTNVYALPHEGGFRAYQIKDNKIFNYFRSKESDGTYTEDKYPETDYDGSWR